MAYTDISDNLDILGDVAVVLSEMDGLSDHNIELFFKKFLTVRKQSKMVDVLSTLPTSFLIRAKPFIVKKLHKQLGI